MTMPADGWLPRQWPSSADADDALPRAFLRTKPQMSDMCARFGDVRGLVRRNVSMKMPLPRSLFVSAHKATDVRPLSLFWQRSWPCAEERLDDPLTKVSMCFGVR
jgi:hypothetical protein